MLKKLKRERYFSEEMSHRMRILKKGQNPKEMPKEPKVYNKVVFHEMQQVLCDDGVKKMLVKCVSKLVS